MYTIKTHINSNTERLIATHTDIHTENIQRLIQPVRGLYFK